MATTCPDPAVMSELFLAAYSGNLAAVKSALKNNALSADVVDPNKVCVGRLSPVGCVNQIDPTKNSTGTQEFLVFERTAAAVLYKYVDERSRIDPFFCTRSEFFPSLANSVEI